MNNLLFLFFTIFSGICLSQNVLKVSYFSQQNGQRFRSALFHDSITKTSLFINYKKEIKLGTAYFNEKGIMVGDSIRYNEEFFKDFNNKQLYSDANVAYLPKNIVKEELDFKWDINYSDKKTIMGYECYKARTYYKGRYYTAYFTKEISVDDGPRKFCGLPGLILELNEDSGKLTIIALHASWIRDSQYIHIDPIKQKAGRM